MKIKKKYFELILDTKQHFQLRFLPYGFGYDKPILIFSLFLFTLYLELPLLNYFYNTKNSDIDYGIQFYDLDEKHWLPDCLRFSFGNYTKSYDLFWRVKLFKTSYETKTIKTLNVKNINNIKTKESIKYSKQIKINNIITSCEYYKEILEFRYKIFKYYIKKGSKYYFRFNIDIKYPSHTISESISCENKDINKLFNDYCKERNIEII